MLTKQNQKNIFITIFLAVLFLLGLYLFLKKPTKKETSALTTERPTKQHLVQYVTASGMLEASTQISVGSIVAGKVIKILVEDNQEVKKGQELAHIDDGIGYSAVREAKGRLAEQEANLSFIQKFYKRQKVLYKAKQLSQNEFDQVTRDLNVASARVEQAKGFLEITEKNYNNLFITSPGDGTIIAKKVNLGQMITSRLDATILFEIAKNLHSMEAEVDVDEADVGLVNVGQQATFTVDTFPKKQFFSSVKRIRYLAKIVNDVVTYATVLDVKNPNLLLRPGMTINVDIKVAENKNALSVPNRALRVNGFRLEKYAKKHEIPFEKLPTKKGLKKPLDALWILEQGTIKQIKVVLGINDEKFTEIKSGVDHNTQVITKFISPAQENQFLKRIFGSKVGG